MIGSVNGAGGIPTSQRPLNGALAGAGAMLGAHVARKYGLGEELAVPIGLVISAVQATLGDWARGLLEEPVHAAVRLPLMLLSRIG